MDGSTALTDTGSTDDKHMPENANQPESSEESIAEEVSKSIENAAQADDEATDSQTEASEEVADETDVESDSVEDAPESAGDDAPSAEATEAAAADDAEAMDESSDEPSDAPKADRKRIVEAVLMAAESPMTAGKIASIAGSGTGREIKKDIQALNEQYDELGLAFRVEEVAGGFQILTRPEYNTWLTKLLRVRQETKLSPAAMETLAIVAYKQPCTRAEVEAIRGVSAGEMINRLREMNIVKIAGRAEDLGRPLLYGTTKKFLEVFGLPSLEDLPQVEALRPPTAKTEKRDIEEIVDDSADESAETSEPAPDVAEESASQTDDADNEEASSDEQAEATGLHLVHDEEEEADDSKE